MNSTDPNWTDTKGKMMTDIEEILKNRGLRNRLFDFAMVLFVFAMVVLSIFLFTKLANASSNRVIDFDWDYPTDVSDLASFKLYMDAVEVATVNDSKIRKYTHTFLTLNDSKACFTMKAFDLGGQSSPSSPAVCIDAPPPEFGAFRVKEQAPRVTGGTGTNTVTKPVSK